MLKKLAIAGVVFGVLLMVALSFLTAKYIDKEEILRATQEREQLMKQRIELEAKVALADSAKKVYEAIVIDMELEAEEMRAKVEMLEKNREVAQMDVRRLRTESDLENQLMEAFPAIKTSMKIVDVPVEGAPNFSLRYWAVPFRFTETFLIDQQNSANYEKQRDKLMVLDEMNVEIIGLQKTITKLEEEKSIAYRQGYDSAYAMYQEINEKYLTLLNKPPSVEFGLPQIGAVAAGFAGGVLVGSIAK